MKVHPEPYIERLGTYLSNGEILEIGCGNGLRSKRLAPYCRSILAIDPDKDMIMVARAQHPDPLITYREGSALELDGLNTSFDSVVFTLSLHHIPASLMGRAIESAARVVRKSGYVIFIEPTFTGSLFEAELVFDACDGDERAQKALAYHSMLTSTSLIEVEEFYGETVFEFDSLRDLQDSMKPKRELKSLQGFMEKNENTLTAQRRINVYRAAI